MGQIIGIIIAIALLIWVLYRWGRKHGSVEQHIDDIKKEVEAWGETPASCSTCGSSCGMEACGVSRNREKPIVYYDDEELDRFAGRSHTDYTPDEIEEFRAVLTTLYPREVSDWLTSLNRRRIALPIVLMEEAQALIASSQDLNS